MDLTEFDHAVYMTGKADQVIEDIEYLTVPLVCYVDGERRIIGEAVVRGSVVRAMLDQPVAHDVIEAVVKGTGEFSLGPFLSSNPPEARLF